MLENLRYNVWKNKYKYGEEQTPEDTINRLVDGIFEVEKKYPDAFSREQIYDVMKDFSKVVLGGSPTFGVGNNELTSVSNCFVIGSSNADSYGSIFKTEEEQVQIMKRRGGVGHDLSVYRPKGMSTMNAAKTCTGIIPFMKRFSNSTNEVAQDGRRGALMLSLSVHHPDIEDFIDAKTNSNEITGANISVRITDEFMDAVVKDEDYEVRWPVNKEPIYKKRISARKVWNKIIHNAWMWAEPGVLFWDKIKEESPADCYSQYQTISTNPCGEVPLSKYSSCILTSLNLTGFVVNPWTKDAYIDINGLKEATRIAVHCLDALVDIEINKIDNILKKIESDPEYDDIKCREYNLWKNIQNTLKGCRRVGLGILGLGDMFAMIGYDYASPESISFYNNLQMLISTTAYEESIWMAKARGSFEVFDFDKEKDNPFIGRIFSVRPDLKDMMKEFGRRNIGLLSIAPTGTISLMTQTTSGIEPLFMPFYKRRVKSETGNFVDPTGQRFDEYLEVHKPYLDWLKVVKNITEPTEEELERFFKESPYFGSTAHDIVWTNKVELQATIQKWIDHSISVTINLPNDVKEEEVEKVYMYAWTNGCKGMTVYRDGSRSGVLVGLDKEKKRPEKLNCDVIHFKNQGEEWVSFVGILENRPYEVFTGPSKDVGVSKQITKGVIIKEKDQDNNKRYIFKYDKMEIEISSIWNREYWNYAKLISAMLRNEISLQDILKCIKSIKDSDDSILSWKAGLTRVLKSYIKNGDKPNKKKDNVCPKCGNEGTLEYKDGCLFCRDCGYSKCG